MKDIDLLESSPRSIELPAQDHAIQRRAVECDEANIISLGNKPVLKVRPRYCCILMCSI